MATSNANRGVQSTTPPYGVGAFFLSFDTALTDRFPHDGHGAITGVANQAIWNGLTAGEFEVIITAIVIDTGSTATVTELHADAGVFAVSRNPACNLNLPMRDGFKVTTAGAGVYIEFRIQKYYE